MAALSRWLTTITPIAGPSITRSTPKARTRTSTTPQHSRPLELLRRSPPSIRSRRSKRRAPFRRRLNGPLLQLRHRVDRPHQPHQWAAMHTSLVRRRMSTHTSTCITASLSLARTLILRQQSAVRSQVSLLKSDILYITRRASISRLPNHCGARLSGCFSLSITRRSGVLATHVPLSA